MKAGEKDTVASKKTTTSTKLNEELFRKYVLQTPTPKSRPPMLLLALIQA